jgi:uncharacterized membrane protein
MPTASSAPSARSCAEVLTAIVAPLATGLFAGAAVYLSLVEHPARMSCGTALALREFAPSYKRAVPMQVALALIATAAALLHWAHGGGGYWLLGATLIASVIPFTLIVIRPVNERLLGMEADDAASGEAAELLTRWGRLHAVRSALGLAAFVLFLVLLARQATSGAG